MKQAISLLIIGIVLMLIIVGCSNDPLTKEEKKQYQQNPNQAGGGCGVIGVDSNKDIGQLPMGDDL